MSRATDLIDLTEVEQMDKMTRQYLETALWSSRDLDTDEPLDKEYSITDFSTDALVKARSDCNNFYDQAREFLEMDGVTADLEQIGHDFWFTRNHHGAGFWDDPEMYAGDENAKKLTDIAHGFGELLVMPTEEGELEFEQGP